MRSAIVLIIAAGLVATPAAAWQSAPANAAADSADTTTVAEPDSGNVTVNEVIADSAMPAAAAPETAPTDVATEAPRHKRDKGFPWGLLGLLGLAGLLSRRRS